MPKGSAGGFEYSGQGFRFPEACCTWEADALSIEAQGKRCCLSLVGVPFPGVLSIAELPGHAWEPDEEQMSLYADTFAEGGLQVQEYDLWIVGGRIECRRFDADQNLL